MRVPVGAFGWGLSNGLKMGLSFIPPWSDFVPNTPWVLFLFISPRNVLLGRAGRFAAAETPAWQPVSSVDRTPLSSTVQENHQGRGAVAAEQRWGNSGGNISDHFLPLSFITPSLSFSKSQCGTSSLQRCWGRGAFLQSSTMPHFSLAILRPHSSLGHRRTFLLAALSKGVIASRRSQLGAASDSATGPFAGRRGREERAADGEGGGW